jgi:two-component system nitrogen regulation response regulator NtrX
MNKIYIIDDEIEICESIKMILEYEDYEVEYSTDPIKALDEISSENFNCILLDIQMNRLNGFEVLDTLYKRNNKTPIIMISAHSSLENAVKATKLGAFDFIEKPIDRDKLLISIRNAVEKYKLLNENEKLKIGTLSGTKILGNSNSIKNILATINRVAKTEARILITGENGTGKELVAQELHLQSLRANNDFVEVNCAAIPNELIESELFGHEKGSFTGAVKQKVGKFMQANNGTLFLDEIGDMSLQAQAKVLKAIEEGKIERVGGEQKLDVNVRLIAATNKNLLEEIEKGNFREDLYHRINVIPIHLPPLRDRREDIPILIDYFNNDLSTKYNLTPKEFSPELQRYLSSLEWKGNIRELRNFIERIIIMLPEQYLKINDIQTISPFQNKKNGDNDLFDISNSFQEFKEKAERLFILKQLEANNWNISKTAEILDIQRSHLYTKMKKYGLDKDIEE